MQTTQSDYVCYSTGLYLYLRSKGFTQTKTGLNKKSGKTYAVYAMTPELSAALTEWREANPNK